MNMARLYRTISCVLLLLVACQQASAHTNPSHTSSRYASIRQGERSVEESTSNAPSSAPSASSPKNYKSHRGTPYSLYGWALAAPILAMALCFTRKRYRSKVGKETDDVEMGDVANGEDSVMNFITLEDDNSITTVSTISSMGVVSTSSSDTLYHNLGY